MSKASTINCETFRATCLVVNKNTNISWSETFWKLDISILLNSSCLRPLYCEQFIKKLSSSSTCFFPICKICCGIFTLWLQTISLICWYYRYGVSCSLNSEWQTSKSELGQLFPLNKRHTQASIGYYITMGDKWREQSVVSSKLVRSQTLCSQPSSITSV